MTKRLFGGALVPLRARSRVPTIPLCGAIAAGIGLAVHAALSSTAAVFFPAVGVQAMAAMVFVSGLLPEPATR